MKQQQSSGENHVMCFWCCQMRKCRRPFPGCSHWVCALSPTAHACKSAAELEAALAKEEAVAGCVVVGEKEMRQRMHELLRRRGVPCDDPRIHAQRLAQEVSLFLSSSLSAPEGGATPAVGSSGGALPVAPAATAGRRTATGDAARPAAAAGPAVVVPGTHRAGPIVIGDAAAVRGKRPRSGGKPDDGMPGASAAGGIRQQRGNNRESAHDLTMIAKERDVVDDEPTASAQGQSTKAPKKPKRQQQQQPKKVQWVQCEACDRWRIVNKREHRRVAAHPEAKWECRDHVRFLTGSLTCETPSDEIRFGEHGEGMPAGYVSSDEDEA
jgi:hypothetical protein